ncbi:MAG: 2-keto-4-pentenoate hydratase/2-oxohepta-3-ene-1,7-dioic acid hydratase in catechol pathway [Granulosicoccus sp.]|jgi:2-keto-4-pentenoate hydratase/2-oxohepta-3-ene-1,7-dioic acid hydratase in catechol pathway
MQKFHTHAGGRLALEASRYFTLDPGDLISFGTTGKGTGSFPCGHKNLLMDEEQGTIGIEIAPLGHLENPIKHQKGGACWCVRSIL